MKRDSPNVMPPPHLAPATRRWWVQVRAGWDLEEHHLKLLTLAGEAWDRAGQAREALQKHGLIFVDRFGQPRSRPEVAIERDARLAYARMLRELDLDAAPPQESRPPGVRR